MLRMFGLQLPFMCETGKSWIVGIGTQGDATMLW